MPLQLPTDTAATRLETKQYELLGRRLGAGVDRRTLVIAVVAATPWIVLLSLVGVPVFTSLGPALYIVPPFLFTYRGLRRDNSGRISLLRWYDGALHHRPGRRRTVRNPLLPAAGFTPRGPVVIHAATLLRPGRSAAGAGIEATGDRS